MSASPLHARAVARSLMRAIEAHFNESITSDLEPDFQYEYEEPNGLQNEVFTLLSLAMRTNRLTHRAKRAIFRRVVLRDADALTRFFVAVIRYPPCAALVEELHCHVDLGLHTSGRRLTCDITLISNLAEHIDRCPVSLDLLAAVRDHLVKELTDNRPYYPVTDLRFRQAMFFSLLGHLRNLHTLRMTIHGPAHKTLSFLRASIQRHLVPFSQHRACVSLCPSLRKVSFHAAGSYHPPTLWHPLAMWTLIDLPSVEELEVEDNPATWNTDTTPSSSSKYHTGPDNNDDDNDDDTITDSAHQAAAHLRILRIKHFRPHPSALVFFASLRKLHTLAISGSIPDPDTNTDASPSTATATSATPSLDLNTVLSLPGLASTLRHLSLDTPCPSPAQQQQHRYLESETLTGLAELRALYAHESMLLGTRGGTEPGGLRLPAKLRRLEIVGGGLEAGLGGEDGVGAPVGSGIAGQLRVLAAECAMGRYPALKCVVWWFRRRGNGGCRLSEGEWDEVEGLFEGAGVRFEMRPYEPWPQGKVGGWRRLPEEEEESGYDE